MSTNDSKFADLLNQYMQNAGYKNTRLANQINKRYGPAFINRSTIRNWRTGFSRTVRDWQQLAAIASVLNLTESQANSLFEAAGLPTINDLWAYQPDDKRQKFLADLIGEPLKLTPSSPTSAPSYDKEKHKVEDLEVGHEVKQKKEESAHLTQEKLKVEETIANTKQYKQEETAQLPTNKPKWGIVIVVIFLAAAVFVAIRFFQPVTLCGESNQITLEAQGQFLPHEGVTSFTKENTPNGILGNRVRAVTGTDKGVLIGYYGDVGTSGNGLSYYDRSGEQPVWANCNEAGATEGKRVNDVLLDVLGRIWVSTDGVSDDKGGVLMFSDNEWAIYSIENDELHTHATYEFNHNKSDETIRLGSIDGVLRFSENQDKWEIEYPGECSNQIYTYARDGIGDIWLGHTGQGISHRINATGAWICYIASDEEKRIDSDSIRGILVYQDNNTNKESLWFATDGGGLTKYEDGEWQTYHINHGLPSDHLHAITTDYYNRIWVATDKGVAYLQDEQWILYTSLNTWDIAFSQDAECLQKEGVCRRDDHVWTGTEQFGLTHSRLPYPDPAINLIEICLKPENGNKQCSSYEEKPYSPIVTETITLMPGQKFHFEIVVSPQTNYELRQDRGDTLRFINGKQDEICEWCEHFPVIGNDSTILTVSEGQNFTFTNDQDNNKLIAPVLDNGKTEETFITTWRVWMHTRYAGPEIRIVFTSDPPAN